MFLMKNLDRTGPDSFAWKMNLSAISKHIENVGQEISIDQPFEKPTLFIAGKNSDYILPEDKASIKTLYPNLDLIFIKNAGHWVHAVVGVRSGRDQTYSDSVFRAGYLTHYRMNPPTFEPPTAHRLTCLQFNYN